MIRKRKVNLPKGSAPGLPSSLDFDSRTVEVTLSTGYRGLRNALFGSFYESLEISSRAIDMSRLNGAPFLKDHKNSVDSIIGTVQRAWIDGDSLKGQVQFADTDSAREVMQLVRDGHLKSVSVGYNVSRYEERDEIDGIPHLTATRWQPLELSAVAVPFDPNSTFRNSETNYEAEVISALGRTRMNDKPQITPEVLAERERVKQIRSLVKDAGFDEGLANEYIDNGSTVDQARLNVEQFKKYQKEQKETVSTGITVEFGTENQTKRSEGFSDYLLQRVDSTYKPTASAVGMFQGRNLLSALERVFERRMFESDYAYAKRVMSNSDLPNLLANVAEKGLARRYELMPKTWQKWARTDTLRNLKEASLVRAGDFASLQKRKEAGEYQHASFGEEKEVAQLEQYGVIHSITDVAVINDDLGAIQKLMSESGLAIARLENQLCYAALTTNKTMGDGQQLYSVAHNNVGTPAPFGPEMFDEVLVKMSRQTSSVDGLNPLNLLPKYIIAPPEHATKIRQALASIQATKTEDVNVFSGSMEVIVDAELSGDDVYFAADQNVVDTVVLYRLAGQENARVESRVKWENDAIQLKVSHAACAEPADYRGLLKGTYSAEDEE